MPLLNKATVIGEWHGHFYEVDGKEYFQECTREEYDALALPNAGAPNVPGKWLYSTAGMKKYDTKDGFLDNTTFETLNTGDHVAVVNGKRTLLKGYVEAAGKLEI